MPKSSIPADSPLLDKPSFQLTLKWSTDNLPKRLAFFKKTSYTERSYGPFSSTFASEADQLRCCKGILHSFFITIRRMGFLEV